MVETVSTIDRTSGALWFHNPGQNHPLLQLFSEKL